MQNLLDKNDATKMVLTVLSNSIPLDMETMNHFLLLGIELLKGGNNKVQKSIYNYFITFPKSEYIFAKFFNIIQNQVNHLTNQQNREISEDELVEDFLDLKPLILERTLNFLQLMTEGHYLELQNYIRHQTNSRNNYDIIGMIIELLKAYLHKKSMNEANYENIIQCIETLTEFIQVK